MRRLRAHRRSGGRFESFLTSSRCALQNPGFGRSKPPVRQDHRTARTRSTKRSAFFSQAKRIRGGLCPFAVPLAMFGKGKIICANREGTKGFDSNLFGAALPCIPLLPLLPPSLAAALLRTSRAGGTCGAFGPPVEIPMSECSLCLPIGALLAPEVRAFQPVEQGVKGLVSARTDFFFLDPIEPGLQTCHFLR